MFPVITHIDDLRNQVKHLPEILFVKQTNGTTVVCYACQDSKTFTGESEYWARECRGITFDESGKLVARPLHKFFNVGERSDTTEQIIDWNNVADIQDKRDGSMMIGVLLDSGFAWKTKKAFTSPPALLCNELYGESTPEYKAAYDLCIKGYTPIFEYTAPSNRVVVKYEESKLVLLDVRKMDTGDYLTREQLVDITDLYNIPLVDSFYDRLISDGYDTFKNDLEHKTLFEGYVLKFNNGERIKVKSAWYIMLHRLVTFVNEQDVAQMVIDETIDDCGLPRTKVRGFKQLKF